MKRSLYPHAPRKPFTRRSPNKYAPGVPLYTYKFLWDSSAGPARGPYPTRDGHETYVPVSKVPAQAILATQHHKSTRRDWRGRIIPVPEFSGKLPVCKSFRNHRWTPSNQREGMVELGEVCRRCKATRIVSLKVTVSRRPA